MAATGNRGGGQRSKGDRKFVGSRVSTDLHDRLSENARLAGFKNTSEYVAQLIEADDRKLRAAGADAYRPHQEEFPIGRMAS